VSLQAADFNAGFATELVYHAGIWPAWRYRLIGIQFIAGDLPQNAGRHDLCPTGSSHAPGAPLQRNSGSYWQRSHLSANSRLDSLISFSVGVIPRNGQCTVGNRVQLALDVTRATATAASATESCRNQRAFHFGRCRSRCPETFSSRSSTPAGDQ